MLSYVGTDYLLPHKFKKIEIIDFGFRKGYKVSENFSNGTCIYCFKFLPICVRLSPSSINYVRKKISFECTNSMTRQTSFRSKYNDKIH